ncbi:MAG TPA: hypothetical protein PLZ84_01330 [Clostridia bacterium]|nr:hypothetical protein [Clostridia bacterium]
MQRLDIAGYIGIVLGIVALVGVYMSKRIARMILRNNAAGNEEALEKYSLAVKAVCLVLMIAAFILVVVL